MQAAHPNHGCEPIDITTVSVLEGTRVGKVGSKCSISPSSDCRLIVVVIVEDDNIKNNKSNISVDSRLRK